MPGTDAARLERDILTVRGEQVCLQHQLDDAVQCELRGLAMVDAARAVQGRCRRMVDQCAEAISSLQDELRESRER